MNEQGMTVSNLKKVFGYTQTCADHDRQTKNGPNKMLFLVFLCLFVEINPI